LKYPSDASVPAGRVVLVGATVTLGGGGGEVFGTVTGGAVVVVDVEVIAVVGSGTGALVEPDATDADRVSVPEQATRRTMPIAPMSTPTR